jgi:hypothetical protein
MGHPSAAHPFLRAPESDFVDVLQTGLLTDTEVTLIKEAIDVTRGLHTAEGRLVWTHGDFGPGNCLVTRTRQGLAPSGSRFRKSICRMSDVLMSLPFSAGIAVSSAVRLVSRERIRRAQRAFFKGFAPQRWLAIDSSCLDRAARGTSLYGLHESAATLKILGRYAQRLAQLPRPLRAIFRAHLRRTVTPHMVCTGSRGTGLRQWACGTHSGMR